MTENAATDPDAEGETPFEQLASCFAPGKEAWKEAGNRFTSEELKHLSVTWSSARLVEESKPDYRVD